MDVTGPSNLADWHFALFAPLPDVRLGVAVLSATPPRLVVGAQDGWHSGSSQHLKTNI
jgi:hypothetical protein